MINIIFSDNDMTELNKILNKAVVNDPALCPNGCGRSYKGAVRRSNLKQHLIYACGVNPQFTCNICQKQMRRMQSFRYHMASVHSQFT